MRDDNLIFNSNTTISESTYSAILNTGKWPVKGVWVEIIHTGVVGGAPATGAQITANVEYSDSATFAGNAVQGPDLVVQQNTAAFRRAKLCQSQLRYARVRYTVTGTSPSFTGIYAHVTSGPARDDGAGVNTV